VFTVQYTVSTYTKQMHFILKGLICKHNTSCHYQIFKLNKPATE